MSLKVGDTFNSFEEFSNSLEKYSKDKFVLYTKADSQTVEKANLKLAVGKPKFSERFKYRYILLQCKHAERNKKKKTNGLGLRPNQRTFNQGCKAELYVSIDRDSDKLVILRHNEDHNHPTEQDMYVQYPEQRRLADKDRMTAETMLNMGVKVKLLQEFFKSTGQHFISVKDLHNIRQQSQKLKYGDKTDEQILIEELSEMSVKDPDASVSFTVDDNGVLISLLIVTGDMKELFQLYPEIMFIDGTYSVNKLRMPMYSFVIEDGNGCGQSVGYAFVVNERTETLEGVLGDLGKVHDLSKVRVAIVDRALNEIAAIKKTMPSTKIQLCKFHVLQAMTREIKKAPVDQSTRNAIIKVAREMVFARSEESFVKKLETFAKTSPQCLMNYYNRNWDKNKEFWAAYLTNTCINLGNTTNNRIESHNQKIKGILDRNKSLSEAVRGILLLHKSKTYAADHESFNQTMKVPYRLGEDDKITDVIAKSLTPYASQLVIDELKFARRNKDLYTSSTSCTCTLSTTMGLPCRHIFARRMAVQDPETSIFMKEDALERWHIDYYRNIRNKRKMEDEDTGDQTPVFKQSIFKEPSRPKTKDGKFKEAMLTLTRMADYLSFLGSREFSEKLDTIQYLYSLWCDGKFPIILPQIDHTEEETPINAENNNNSMESPLMSPQKDQTQEETPIKTVNNNSYNETPSPVSSEQNKSPCQSTSSPTSDHLTRLDSPSFSKSKVKRKLTMDLTGAHVSKDILHEFKNFTLPKTPPVRGNAKIKRKQQVSCKENVYQGRQRFLKKKKTCQTRAFQPADVTIGPSEWLSDVHINTAQNILGNQFPKMPGLQDTILGSKLQFDVNAGDFVQILHDGSSHWVVASNLFCEDNCVEIFDSLYSSVPVNVKMQLACIMMLQKSELTINIVNFQRQSNSKDCGLFAIAAATDLCHGNDPSRKLYNQNLLRNHFLTCLEN